MPPWYALALGRTAFIVGAPRLIGRCSSHIAGSDGQAAQIQAEDFCEMHVMSSINEVRSMEQSGLETEHSGPYGDLPILIFSHDPAKSMATENAAQKKMESGLDPDAGRPQEALHKEPQNHRPQQRSFHPDRTHRPDRQRSPAVHRADSRHGSATHQLRFHNNGITPLAWALQLCVNQASQQ